MNIRPLPSLHYTTFPGRSWPCFGTYSPLQLHKMEPSTRHVEKVHSYSLSVSFLAFVVVVVCVCVLHSLLQACLSWFYATDMKTMKCQISLFRRFLTFGRAENATSGCAFLGSSDGMLQLGCIHTAKATEFKNSCEIQPCLICFSVWPVSVGPNLFDSE